MACEHPGHSHTADNFETSGNTGFINRLKNLDRVVLAFVLLMAVVGIATPQQFWPSLSFVGNSLADIAPFLLLSIAIAAGVKATGADQLIGAAFRANAGKAVMVAALVGALSPFCSCGVVPLIAALLAAGVPLGPVMAFWLASPVIDPEMMLVTAGVLGVEFTVAKTLSAIVIGAVGGYATVAIQKAGGFSDPLRGIEVSTCGTSAITKPAKPHWKFWDDKDRMKDFVGEFRRTGWFLLKWLSIAFLLEGLMTNNLPMDNIGQTLAGLGLWSIPAAAFVGVPAYLNGYAAIPLADTLMQMGLSKGAALSFMVGGGITCIPAMVAVKAMTRLPVFLTYVAIALTGSVAVGLLYALWGGVIG